jgi:hypothetical protein
VLYNAHTIHGAYAGLDRGEDRFRIGVTPLCAGKRFRFARKARKRWSEACLKRDPRLFLNELVREIEHRAFINAAGFEADAHMASNSICDFWKAVAAHETGSRLSVVRTSFGNIVQKSCRSHRMCVKPLACFVQAPGKARGQRGDGAAMAPDGFRRGCRFQHGFALLRIGHMTVWEQSQELAVVRETIHVQQAAPVEDGNLASIVLVPGKDGPQSAFPIAAEDFIEKRTANERRMPALAAKNRMNDGGARFRCHTQHLGGCGGADQRHVHGQKQKPFHVCRQGGHSRLYAREHPLGEIGVVDVGHSQCRQFRRQQVRQITRYRMDAPHASLAQACHRVAYGSPPAKGQKRLERSHARGVAGREHNGGYGACRTDVCGERHGLFLPSVLRRLRHIHPMLGEDFLGLFPAVENDAGATLLLEGWIEMDDFLAIDPAEFLFHGAFEPAGEFFEHNVKARIEVAPQIRTVR